MKKASRWLSLLLVLALFLSVCPSASAQAEGMALEDLDYYTWSSWRTGVGVQTYGDESAIGLTVQTTESNVWIYEQASIDSTVLHKMQDVGTKLLVLGYEPGDGSQYTEFYQVRYTDENGTVIEGYTECRQVEIYIAPEIEPDAEPWTPGDSEYVLGFKTEGADGYVWERAKVTADGELVWEIIEGETGATLTLDTTSRDALCYIYRCTAKNGTETIAQSGDMRLIREDIALWMTAETSDEMLGLAIRAKSLDSLLIDSSNMLLHIRTGEALAEFDPETGYLMDLTYYFDVAHYDVETGVLTPLYSDVYGN